ncbi:MAG TPA: alpha/beta fold hydrolase [Gemmatimonadales bacterium]|nr:alpha/beta fold hydrolase [Gemmatimonadales bacterium]
MSDSARDSLRRLVVTLTVTLLALPGAARAQQRPAFAGLYRLYQGGTEVGRERFERSGRVAEFSVVVPVIGLKLDSRTAFDSTGAFQRFDAEAYNAAGDTLLGTFSVTASGALLQTQSTSKRTGQTKTGQAAGPVAGVIPAQSVAVVALLARRFARDTTIRMLIMGSDSVVPVTIAHHGDSATVSFAGIAATTLTTGGRAWPIDIAAQRVHAELWNGGDSLAPLPGLRRPVADYRAPAGAPYTAEEVRIPVRSLQGDTFSLAGTLTLPVAAARPVPVVVTITGSGQQTRDEDLWPLLPAYRPFRVIAERLAVAGIGVLRLDDRGAGGSTGAGGTTADFADDVRQEVAWLRRRPDVSRVALVGHSEGGAIAPLVAKDDATLAAIVLLAGPGKSGRAILTDQFRRPIETAPGLSDSARRAQLALVSQRVDQVMQSSPWMRWFAAYDPLPTARAVRVPVLILQGALDRQVSAGQADTLAAAFRAGGNRDVTVKVYPGLNHLFLHTDGDGSPTEYPALKDTTLPAQVQDDLAAWLTARLR